MVSRNSADADRAVSVTTTPAELVAPPPDTTTVEVTGTTSEAPVAAAQTQGIFILKVFIYYKYPALMWAPGLG